MTAAWTSRTSTCGRPVSQVIDRSASRSASRWTMSISFWSSRLGDRLVGLLALLAVGRREALDQLAGDADDDLARPEAGHLLGLLERDRAVVDDGGDVGDGARLHVATGPGACGRRRGRCRARRRRSRRRAPWRTRCRRRAPCRRPATRRRRAARIRRQKAIQASGRRVERASRIAASASARPSRRVPLPWAISGRPPPRPSIAATAARDEVAGRRCRARRGRR